MEALLRAVTGPDGRPHLGRARFDGALLPGGTSLREACFEGDASFDRARFLGGVSFYGARFLGHVSFGGARFGGSATFHDARFHRHASFEEAVFVGDALFGDAVWSADATFTRAVFTGAAAFDRAHFSRDADLRAVRFGAAVSFRKVQVTRHARFESARFRRDLWLGPLAVGGRLVLTNATAHGALRVHTAARQVVARRATVHGPAEFRVRHAQLDLEESAFDDAASIRSMAHPFQCLAEPSWPDPDAPAQLLSLRRVSVPRLHLTDVDLSRCRFAGLRRPDLLSLTGQCRFATVPGRLRSHAILADDMGSDQVEHLADLYHQLAQAMAESDASVARDFRHRALEARRRADGHHRLRCLLPWGATPK
jgi:Pentapeptide repeats (9 copies)